MLWLVRFCHRGPGCHTHINFSSLRGKKTIRCLETHFTISHLTQFWTYHRGNCLRRARDKVITVRLPGKAQDLKTFQLGVTLNSLMQWFSTSASWPRSALAARENNANNWMKTNHVIIHWYMDSLIMEFNFWKEKMLPVYLTFAIKGHVSNLQYFGTNVSVTC